MNKSSLAVIDWLSNWNGNNGQKLGLFCEQMKNTLGIKRISIYTLTRSSLPMQNISFNCGETEVVRRQIDCSRENSSGQIIICLSISAYYEWNEYFLLIKVGNFSFTQLNYSKLFDEIQSNPIPDLGILVIGYPNLANSDREYPIFFHRNHITLFGTPFPAYEEDWKCATKWLFEFYSKTTKASFYKEVLNSPNKKLIETNNCSILIKDVLKDLFIKYIIYLKGKAFIMEDRKSKRQFISMTLFGTRPRYQCSAVRNAQVWPMVYPRWNLRYYIPAQSLSKYRPLPSAQVLFVLRKLGVDLVEVDDLELGPMLWRFKVMQDENVSRFIIRDIDDILSTRDALCVDFWMQSEKVLHCTRDHQSHSTWMPLLGGLFGAKRKELADLCQNNVSYSAMKKYTSKYVDDMKYINTHIWTCVPPEQIDCCDEFSWWKWSGAHPFPEMKINPESFVGDNRGMKCFIPE